MFFLAEARFQEVKNKKLEDIARLTKDLEETEDQEDKAAIKRKLKELAEEMKEVP